MYLKMRSFSVGLMYEGFDGYVIGGLVVGESVDEMLEIIVYIVFLFFKDKLCYLMGVGMFENILDVISLGVDMFDCVMFIRNVRNVIFFMYFGKIFIKNAFYKLDNIFIEENCVCYVCKCYFKVYLYYFFRVKEFIYVCLVSLYNLYFYLELVKNVRNVILEKWFLSFKKEFLEKYNFCFY